MDSTKKTKWTRTRARITVRFGNRVALEFPLRDNDVLGLGGVRVGAVPLRNAAVLFHPWIRSVDGVEYTRFRLARVRDLEGGGVAIDTLAAGIPRHESAYGDEYDDRQFRVSQADAPVEDRLTWILRPESLALDGVRYEGFAYAFEFESATQKVYRIVTVGTWEIGGRAEGNTILSQGQVTPAVYTAAPDTHFTSACLKLLRDFGKPLNMSFQWNHRWGPHQSFDFLASAQGSLLGFWPAKADVRSFVQKNPGEDVFFVVDAAHGKASGRFEVPCKCVLFAPALRRGSGQAGKAGLPGHAMRNRWQAAHDFVADTTRAFFGIRKSRPLPERTLPYGQSLQPDGRFLMRAGGRWVPSREWLMALADEYLPNLAAQGVRRVMPEPVSESDPTERGRLCKLHDGIHGDLNVGSCCTTHRYRPAEFFGGMEAWRYFYNKAHALGMEAGVWLGAHMSSHAAIFEDHPDWLLRGGNTRPYAGGYPSHQVAVVNMNTAARQWILDDLKRWKDEGGIDYVWFDSMGNLALLPVDYSRDMESNAPGVAELIAGIQAIGIPTIEVEGISPFGVGACYIMDTDPAQSGGVQWIAGQNCWEWYDGNEDMLLGQQPRAGIHASRTEADARRRFFRCLANRCVPEMARYAPPGGPGVPWYREMVDTYLAVERDLVQRRLLPEQRGVIWNNLATQTLFAFAAFTLELPRGARVETLCGAAATPLGGGRSLAAEPWQVYRITVPDPGGKAAC